MKRIRWRWYLLPYIAPLLVFVQSLYGGWTAVLAPFLTFLWHPLSDTKIVQLAGREALSGASREDGKYLALVRFYPLVHGGLLLWVCSLVVGLSWVDYVALTFSLGICGGVVGITAAHELVHRPRRSDRGIGVFQLLMVSYPHFRVEHVLGHHPFVGTPRDPATAKLGESLYAFWWRSIWGQFFSAWRIEADRLRRHGLGALSPRNRMIQYGVGLTAIYAGIFLAFGTAAVGLFAGQSFFSVLLLETINYIEHYGLTRKKRADGSYAPVGPEDSWDSAYRLSSLFLFNLNFHSLHHVVAARSYDGLAPLEAAPQLPHGYSRMLLLALVPPWWRKVVDPIISAGAGPGPS